jgi:hypothetical protein
MAAADVNAMIDRITVVGDPQQPMPVTTVTVSTADGRRREASYDSSVRRHDLDQERDALVVKFHTLVDPRLGAEEATRLIDAVDTMEATTASV